MRFSNRPFMRTLSKTMAICLPLLWVGCELEVGGKVTVAGAAGEVPVRGATVTLVGTSKSGLRVDTSATSNATGEYRFAVEPGEYTLRIEGQGLEFNVTEKQVTVTESPSIGNDFRAELVDYADTVCASGTAHSFSLDFKPVAGALISILEFPGRVAVANEWGEFLFCGLPVGSLATFRLTAKGYHESMTKTFVLPATQLSEIHFQAPSNLIFAALRTASGATAQGHHLVTTVTPEENNWVGAGGIPFVKVVAFQVDPADPFNDPGVPLDVNPIYFSSTKIVVGNGYVAWPDPKMRETDRDGGVLFKDVPAGTYRLEASRPGYEFEAVVMKTGDSPAVTNAVPGYNLGGRCAELSLCD